MTSFIVKVFLNLFVVIDPIGLAPTFITLAGDRSPEEQSLVARKAIFVAGGILVAFGLFGNWLLHHLGISIEAFQVATGLLLLKIAIDMVLAHRERETAEEEQEAKTREDISVFPLAIPLIAGPGTLASLLILQSEANAYSFGWLVVLAIAAVVLLIAYIVLCLSRYLADLLGQTGINVVTRILGILLAALAMQYILNGLVVILKDAIA
jgi:multiple antibiotic resistance protein